MAFPTTLDSFTTKNTGDIILAAHMNDVQSSIVAGQVKIGVDSSAVTTTLDYLVKNAASIDPGHLHTSAGINGQITVAKGGTGLATVAANRLMGTDGTLDNVVAVTITSPLTLASGALSINTVPVTKGGTGLATIADNAILIATAADTLSALTIGTEGQVLAVTSGAPAWATNVAATDEKAKITTNDTTTGFLDTKIVVVSPIAKAVTSPGADERLSLSLDTVPITSGGTGATTAGGARTALGLVIGTDVQAEDADLTAIAALANTDSNFIVGNGSTWVAESGATVRTSIGLDTWPGTANITTLGTITTGVWSGTAVGVTKGGTGQTTIADNAILIATALDTLTALTIGTEGDLLTVTSGAPAWTAATFLASDAADTMTASEAGTLLTVNQTGAGAIIDIQDGGTSRLKVADKGIITQTSLLDAATGDEIGVALAPTVNKATSGNFTALDILLVDTALPETDNRFINCRSGGVDQFQVVYDSFVNVAMKIGTIGTKDIVLSVNNLSPIIRMQSQAGSGGNSQIQLGKASTAFGLLLKHEPGVNSTISMSQGNDSSPDLIWTYAEAGLLQTVYHDITVNEASAAALTINQQGAGDIIDIQDGGTTVFGVADGGQFTAFTKRLTTSGITASVTQTQGQGALTSDINEVATVGTTNDTVTLPTAAAGLEILIINNGANTLQIFPASGDDLGAGVDTATTLAAGSNITYAAYDATNWEIK